jgi:hypothetical protein
MSALDVYGAIGAFNPARTVPQASTYPVSRVYLRWKKRAIMRGFDWYWRLVTILFWAMALASLIGLIFEFMIGPTITEVE